MAKHNRMKSLRAARKRGFSIIELLVAIIIIGILVSVLVPVISNRTEQARIATANSELSAIADAMDRVAVDTGYYVRLFALNDVLRGDGVGFDRGQSGNDRIDGLTDLVPAGGFYNLPGSAQNGLFIDPNTGDFATGISRDNFISVRFFQAESNYSPTAWNGPYINWRRDRNAYNSLVAPDGLPDDPWGNNYVLFTRLGMMVEPAGEFRTSVNQDSNDGSFSSGAAYEADIFDRPTVLSLGPDGKPGNGITGSPDNEFGKANDLYVQFGK